MQKVLLLIVIIAIGSGASIHGEALDFVILLDVSESMLPYFDDTVTYLVRDIVDEHLVAGDAFHLLSFSSLPEIEISGTISETRNSSDLLARIFLLQPLGRYTDLVLALKFLQTYVGRLEDSTEKKILILTDGIHDPPPGSPFPASDRDLIEQETSRIAREISGEGWDLGVVRFPVDTDATPGGEESESDSGQSETSTEEQQADIATDDIVGSIVSGTNDRENLGSLSTTRDSNELSVDSNGDSGVTDVSVFTGDRDTTGSVEVDETNGSLDSTAFSGSSDATQAEVPTGTGDSIATSESGIGDTDQNGSRTDDASVESSVLEDLAQEMGVEIVEVTEDSIGSTEISNEATGTPRLVFPGHLGSVRRTFAAEFELVPFNDEPHSVEVASVFWNEVDILARKERTTLRGQKRKLRLRFTLPDRVETGEMSIPIRIVFTDDLRIYPREGNIAFELRGSSVDVGRLLRTLGIIGVVVAGMGLLALLAFLVRRIITSTSTQKTPGIRFKEIGPGETAIEMIVEGQNRKIGMRNIHVIKDSASRSIGGGKSSYLIFAYPIRSRIAELTRSGDEYNFVPKHEDARNENGKSAGGATIPNCIGQPIQIRSARGSEVSLLFTYYISPLERINRIMHSIDGPGRSRG